MSYKVGFTGTKYGLSSKQKREIKEELINITKRSEHVEFHHGNDKGSDEETALIAKQLGYYIVAHPPANTYRMSTLVDLNDEIRKPKDYLKRNHNIVDEVDELLAAPRQLDEILRSGTWATIRYAKKKLKLPNAKIKKITTFFPVARHKDSGPIFD